MIKVNKDFTNPPTRLSSVNCLKSRTDIINAQNASGCSSYYYRDGSIDDLNILYHEKCAYCESKLNVSSPARVDHFRPQNGSEKRSHDGYYWLAYEWSNLVLTCEICNGKRFKSDKFPIQDEQFRATSPFSNQKQDYADFLSNSKYLLAENCLLIHPEIDEPKAHIAFMPDGKPKALSLKGKITIETCGLGRESLNIERKKIVDDLRKDIRKLFYDFNANRISMETLKLGLKRLFKQALLAQMSKRQYSSFHYSLFKNFEYFIIRTLSPKIAKVVRFQFEEFLEQNGL